MRYPSPVQHSPLLNGVDAKTVQTISAALTEKLWQKGHQIGGSADLAESFFVVREGRVKIVRSNSHDGRELTVWLLGPGDGFDFVSLLDGRPHAVTAWALDPVRTLSAPAALWRQCLQDSRALRLAVYRYVGEKMRELTDLAGDLALYDTSTRLSHLLLRHFDGDGNSDNLLADLPQRELAAMIGTVRVVVSRALAAMTQRGIVQLRDGAIHGVDLKRLLAQAEAGLNPWRSDTRATQRGRM